VWVELAARNNAEWCDAVCAAHGLFGSFHDHVWACGERTPPLHPDAVTLDASATATDVLAHVDNSSPGCSVKDSFSALDLAPAGFRVLFDATWIARKHIGGDGPPSDGWSRVSNAHELARWRSVSDRDLGDELLDRDDIVILARHRSGNEECVAGAVLNWSESAIGISNVFGPDLDSVWSACVDYADHCFSDMPIVGYEAGAPLAAALRHGFEEIGHLRVWVDDRTSQPRR
jgi:hypothetical protein